MTLHEDTGLIPVRPASDPSDERKSEATARGDVSYLDDQKPVRIGDFALARQFLRSEGTRQAGFRAELVERFTGGKHAPVLFQDGEAHQRQRSATARFFAPKVVGTRYRELMERLSERLVQRFRAAGSAELDTMSLELAVAVVAEIVGLTESDQTGMAQRLHRLSSSGDPLHNRFGAFMQFVAGQWRLLVFYRNDVRPAIQARRQARREDVISHLLDQGYSNREILTECITYASAGMATTREFIVMAAWHLLERDDLRRRFLDSDEPGQFALLEEVLRLEPVVSTLYRRTKQEMALATADHSMTIPAGALVAVDVRAANTDGVAGKCPFQLDAGRDLKSKASASVLSFGDGPHRCPGASVALQETAIFLNLLLRVPDIRLSRAPSIGWNQMTTGYELRGAVISADR